MPFDPTIFVVDDAAVRNFASTRAPVGVQPNYVLLLITYKYAFSFQLNHSHSLNERPDTMAQGGPCGKLFGTAVGLGGIPCRIDITSRCRMEGRTWLKNRDT